VKRPLIGLPCQVSAAASVSSHAQSVYDSFFDIGITIADLRSFGVARGFHLLWDLAWRKTRSKHELAYLTKLFRIKCGDIQEYDVPQVTT